MTENPTLVEELRESARLAAAKAKCPVEDYITWSAANEIERLRGTAQASLGASWQCLRCGTVDAFGPVSTEEK